MPVIPVTRGSSEEDSPFSPDGVVSSSGISVRGGAGEEAASFGRELEEIMAGVSNGEDRECKEEECSGVVAEKQTTNNQLRGENLISNQI